MPKRKRTPSFSSADSQFGPNQFSFSHHQQQNQFSHQQHNQNAFSSQSAEPMNIFKTPKNSNKRRKKLTKSTEKNVIQDQIQYGWLDTPTREQVKEVDHCRNNNMFDCWFDASPVMEEKENNCSLVVNVSPKLSTARRRRRYTGGSDNQEDANDSFSMIDESGMMCSPPPSRSKSGTTAARLIRSAEQCRMPVRRALDTYKPPTSQSYEEEIVRLPFMPRDANSEANRAENCSATGRGDLFSDPQRGCTMGFC